MKKTVEEINNTEVKDEGLSTLSIKILCSATRLNFHLSFPFRAVVKAAPK